MQHKYDNLLNGSAAKLLKIFRDRKIKSYLFSAFISTTVAFIAGHAQAAELDLDTARILARTAEDASTRQNATAVVTVVDSGAHVLLVERMPGAQLASIDISARKAVSAVLYKRSTRMFEESLAGGRTGILALPNAMPAAGGVPIIRDGLLLGAIGVSGGTNAQDDACAQIAVDAVNHGQTAP